MNMDGGQKRLKIMKKKYVVRVKLSAAVLIVQVFSRYITRD